MYKTHFERAKETVTWRQFARRGYSAFASLKRQVRIGVLSAATLSTGSKPYTLRGTGGRARGEAGRGDRERHHGSAD